MPTRITLNRNLLQGEAKSLATACRMARAPNAAKDATRAGATATLPDACQHCGGRGYRLGTRGAYAEASICACVQSCPTCAGRAQCDRAGPNGIETVACTDPSLSVVVNLVNSALVPARYADATFDNFMGFRERDREAAAKIKQWRAHFAPLQHRGLVVTGPVGVGKTYLLAALALELAQKGVSVRFTDFFQLLAELRAGFSEGKSDATQLAPLIEVDVLVIDELGKGRCRDFDRAVIDQLISSRYNQRKTVIGSTNYRVQDYNRAYFANQTFSDPKAASTGGEFEGEGPEFGFLEARIGKRTFSRLREMTNFIELDGTDYRRKGMP